MEQKDRYLMVHTTSHTHTSVPTCTANRSKYVCQHASYHNSGGFRFGGQLQGQGHCPIGNFTWFHGVLRVFVAINPG